MSDLTIDETNLPTEFNGFPVKRSFKDFKRKRSSNNTVIVHPSGVKLSKCREGYVILCVKLDCKKQAPHNGIVCMEHRGNYKQCTHPNCNRRSTFGYELNNPLVCKVHLNHDMFHVINKICEINGCTKRKLYGVEFGHATHCIKHGKFLGMTNATDKRCEVKDCELVAMYGFKGNKATHCANHGHILKMINVKRPVCGVVDCLLRACYGLKDMKPTHCTEHGKILKMRDVVNKRCKALSCETRASHGSNWKSPTHCAKHGNELNMADVVTKRCKTNGCDIIATYGLVDKKVTHCASHGRQLKMTDVRNKNCATDGCMFQPSYGLKWRRATRCSKHGRLLGMTDVINQRCQTMGCDTLPSYGIVGGTRTHCAAHGHQLGMTNISGKLCIHLNCETRASLGPMFSSDKNHCKTHATLNEYGVTQRNPICYDVTCRNKATFISPNDLNIFPIRCSDHKLPNDIELINRQCPTCEQIVYYPENQQCCMECGQYRIRANIHAKEEIVKQMLVSKHIDNIHDKRIQGGIFLHRPDFLITSEFGYIIVEVDENQHKHFSLEEEETRMKTVYHDIQLTTPNKEVIFVRYNPDSYSGDQYDNNTKLEHLCKVIMILKPLNTIGCELGCIKLFYYGFDGNIGYDIWPLQ